LLKPERVEKTAASTCVGLAGPTEIVFASACRTRSATRTSTSFSRYQTDTVVIFRVTLKHSSFSVGRGQRLSDIYKTSTADLEAVDFAIYAVNESR
jgi:hypothetical protein